MDEQQEAPEPATPVVAATFEGDVITGQEGRLPAVSFEMPDSYTRGTILRMEVEVRVKNVRYEEGRRGDLVRQHVLVLESIALKAAFQSHEEVSVGGSASATPDQTSEGAEEIGLEIGRTANLWGATASNGHPIEQLQEAGF